MKRLLISNLLRQVRFTTQEFFCHLAELAKRQRVLSSKFSTRMFQRNNHTERIAPLSTIKQIVTSTLMKQNTVILRPFSIVLERIVNKACCSGTTMHNHLVLIQGLSKRVKNILGSKINICANPSLLV
jgi:spore coat protein CotF